MTTPDERARAQADAIAFLRELRDDRRIPNVPASVRRRAETLLRHIASAEEVRDILEMTLRAYTAEKERDQLRGTAAAVKWRVRMLRAAVWGVLLLLGVGLGYTFR